MVADASLAILGWTRVAILIGCFAGAAHLDNKQRSVPNSYWKVWIKSAVLLWLLEGYVLSRSELLAISNLRLFHVKQ